MDSFRITESSLMAKDQEYLNKFSEAVQIPRDGKSVAEAITKTEKIQETPERKKPELPEVKKAAEKLNSTLQIVNTKLQVNIDSETGKIVVKLVNSENGEVIREIPPESILKLSARIAEYIGNWPENKTAAAVEGTVIDKIV